MLKPPLRVIRVSLNNPVIESYSDMTLVEGGLDRPMQTTSFAQKKYWELSATSVFADYQRCNHNLLKNATYLPKIRWHSTHDIAGLGTTSQQFGYHLVELAIGPAERRGFW